MYFTKDQTENIFTYHFAFIELAVKEHALVVTLNRPNKKNALHPVMLNEMAFAFAYAHHHGDIRVVLLQANGDIFCSGADLKAFMGVIEEHDSTVPTAEEEILIGEIFFKCHKPCVVKVQGPVFAGGFLLLAGATQVVAKEGIRLGLPEVKRGLFPFQVMASLMDVMPARKVLDWCLRGYDLPVDEAKELGLVTEIAQESELDEAVNKIVKELSANAPLALHYGIEAYRKLSQGSQSEKHKYLRDMLGKVIQTQDAREGIQAFKEKRNPVWEGK
ncbi:enoyl-CoA hydratase/isomerase family protein [Sediminitomix flava]|uniref:Enoyl-CoA hydratase/carnithine racemase n=1 Tax=Sediminitomix flava TaxID=379075 RepID=A0A316A2K6_SEDFL|nr:enoyl-CoA hydratase-related protein [Sediminitomix flava]PWJ43937.1 enoyl-CoA hydratase/carnithine racemase [Sediminitomix flava]